MKYLPSVAISIAVGSAVAVGLYITHDTECLWGLCVLIIAWWAIPDEDTGETS